MKNSQMSYSGILVFCVITMMTHWKTKQNKTNINNA